MLVGRLFLRMTKFAVVVLLASTSVSFGWAVSKPCLLATTV